MLQIMANRDPSVLKAVSEHGRLYSTLFNSLPLSSTTLTVYHLLKVEYPELFIKLMLLNSCYLHDAVLARYVL